ncbi:hypothetical protein WJ969_26425 [Achromobacter xylosoxidans]
MRSEPVLPLQTADIGGYAMSYTEYGEGEPLVLVHGSLSDCRYWKSQMAPLGRSFRVLAVCLRRYWPETWDGEGEGFRWRSMAPTCWPSSTRSRASRPTW